MATRRGRIHRKFALASRRLARTATLQDPKDFQDRLVDTLNRTKAAKAGEIVHVEKVEAAHQWKLFFRGLPSATAFHNRERMQAATVSGEEGRNVFKFVRREALGELGWEVDTAFPQEAAHPCAVVRLVKSHLACG